MRELRFIVSYTNTDLLPEVMQRVNQSLAEFGLEERLAQRCHAAVTCKFDQDVPEVPLETIDELKRLIVETFESKSFSEVTVEYQPDTVPNDLTASV